MGVLPDNSTSLAILGGLGLRSAGWIRFQKIQKTEIFAESDLPPCPPPALNIKIDFAAMEWLPKITMN